MKRRLYLAAPFVVLPLAARLLVGPIGDSLASAATRVAPSAFVADELDLAGNGGDPATPTPRRAERRAARLAGSSTPEKRPWVAPAISDAGAQAAVDAGPRATIVVPASAVASAIADKKIGARDAVDEDGKPIGARIHGVGRYRTGLQNGDIIVSVAGTPTPTTAALVEVAMKVVSAGAKKLTGKIRRGDALYDVVLELPARD